MAGGLVVPGAFAALHAVVPSTRRLRLAAGGGVAAAAVDRSAPAGDASADAPAVEFDRSLYDDSPRAGDRVTPADGGTEDDDVTGLLDDSDE